MVKRIITGLLLVGAIFALIFGLRQIHIVFADVAIMFFGIVGSAEMYKSFKKSGMQPMALPLITAMVTVYPAVYFLKDAGLVLTIAVAAVASISVLTLKHERYEVKDALATVFISVYPLAIMGMFLVMNHGLGELLPMFLIFAVTVMTDTMAYFVGVTCKGPKLCPSISPKKTVSGAVGGIIGGIMGAVITFLFFDYFNLFEGFANMSVFSLTGDWKSALPLYIAVGAVCAALSELGDLGASIIKRKIQIKDYGNLFPGHGGVMDRIDGFMYVTPVVYLVFHIIYAVNA